MLHDTHTEAYLHFTGYAQPPPRNIHVGGICSMCAADTQGGGTNRQVDDHILGDTAGAGGSDGVFEKGWGNSECVGGVCLGQ